jgi:hypothetical protein
MPPRRAGVPDGRVAAASWPVRAAATVAAASAMLLVPAHWGDGPLVAVSALGYGLGALAAPLLAVLFRWDRQKVRANRRGVVIRWHEPVLHAALGVGITTGLVHAWLLATELARA